MPALGAARAPRGRTDWEHSSYSAVLVGPGWGLGDARAAWLDTLLALPVRGVVDADAITLLGRRAASREMDLGARWVLTPHPGEFTRLTGADQESVLDDPVGNALAASDRLNAIVVLKGHSTVVAAPDGRFWILDGGNPALATGGSGDVLAGLVAAGVAGGIPPLEAALFGVSLHARPGPGRCAAPGLVSRGGPGSARFPGSLDVKPPILKVKKGARVYDDTAAQEESEYPRPPLPGSGPLPRGRRRRRAGRYTYFPLVIVAIGLFIFFQVAPNTPVSRGSLPGWQVTLHVTPYNDTLIVGVTFVSQAPVEPGGGAAHASMIISLPGTDEQVFVSGDLDRSPMTLRGTVPWLRAAAKVQALVGIGSAHVTLWQRARPPAGRLSDERARRPLHFERGGEMLQLYFLSVAANFLAGVTLSGDWMGERFPSLAGLLAALNGRRARTTIGLAALLVGLGTLFVPADPHIIFGDLFPSVVGLAVGIALIFEVFKQDALYPGDRGAESAEYRGAESAEYRGAESAGDRGAAGNQGRRAPSAYRAALGALGLAAAVLHFFLPERLLF